MQQDPYDAAFGFIAEAEARESMSWDVAWWDTHGPDEQRFYNTVCIFYCADPDNRSQWAEDLGLPQDRADFCPHEFDQANASWGSVLDDMTKRGGGTTVKLEAATSAPGKQVEEILRPEIEVLNANLSFARAFPVRIESCGQANAFYDPEEKAVIFCEEFVSHLQDLEETLQ